MFAAGYTLAMFVRQQMHDAVRRVAVPFAWITTGSWLAATAADAALHAVVGTIVGATGVAVLAAHVLVALVAPTT